MRWKLYDLIIPIVITITLFLVPFFWLKPGFVDLGGDSSRLYYLDPEAVIHQIISNQTIDGALMYAQLPYVVTLFLLKHIIVSTSNLIHFEQGIQLSLSFLSIYLIIIELFKNVEIKHKYKNIAGVIAGLGYVAFISTTSWAISLDTFNQVFLNPLIFLLLLKLFVSKRMLYIYSLLIVSIIFSTNFGYTAAPQLLSFYPFTLLYLLIINKFVYFQKLPWKQLLILLVCFLGLHSYHIIPSAASILDNKTTVNNKIFSEDSKLNSGLHYFDTNRQNFGKISKNLLQPTNYDSKSVFIFMFPLIIVIGLLFSSSRLMTVTSGFFIATLFLVSANVTLIGLRFYRQLFYIPGFLMFRSFYEKWYFVFAFFFALLVGISIFKFTKKLKFPFVLFIFIIIIFGIIYRINPFITGAHYKNEIYQSMSVSQVFDTDPAYIEALEQVKKIPLDGKFLTAPLTEAYFQIVMGKTKGAYIGVSAVQRIGNQNDIAGFWHFGKHQQKIIQTLEEGKQKEFMQILSLHAVKYIFLNSDPRIAKSLPNYPFYSFVKPQITNDIKHFEFYKKLAMDFNSDLIGQSGFYAIYRFQDNWLRPIIYVPSYIYSSLDETIKSDNFQSAYINKINCDTYQICDKEINDISIEFIKQSQAEYSFKINIPKDITKIPILLNENFTNSWKMSIDRDQKVDLIAHLEANELANLWILDTSKIQGVGTIEGKITLDFVKYYKLGLIITIITIIILIINLSVLCYKKYAQKH